MKKKSIIIYILMFTSLCILASFFPIAGTDMTWSLKGIASLREIISIRDTGLITSALTTLFIKYKLLRILSIGIIGTTLFALMRNIIDRKNTTLIFIGFFLFFLLDRLTLASTLLSIHGFTSYLIGILCTLLFLRLYIKDTIQKMNYFILLILGLLLSNLEPVFSFTIFLVTLIYIYRREEMDEYRSLSLLIGELIGLIYNVLRMKLTYTGFSANLLHNFIPTICGQNFIITLVFSTLVMIRAIKVFTDGKMRGATLAIFGMSTFLFSSLLSTNDYLNYVTYIIYNASCLYILMNMTNSRQLKNKLSAYYLFKIIYIIVLSCLGLIDAGSTLFIFIIDILIILELYNHILPTDFLAIPWFIVFIAFSCVNIYIYRDVSIKYRDMNFYIKNKLECTNEDIKLPSKFDIKYLENYVPRCRNEIEEYIEYYDIDIYDKDKTIKIEFKR